MCGLKKNPSTAKEVSSSRTKTTAAVTLGLSHGKTSTFLSEITDGNVSRSWSYRNKKTVAEWLEPVYDEKRKETLKEPYLRCDEFHWPVKGDKSEVKNGDA
ncbi:MAG: transposase [Cenarchaeum sp. SB0666_bin_15]|nr:transposase [Cenarchaeum sp. SB0666_bin_15]